MAMTMARRGRSTKMADSIRSAPIEDGRHRACLNRHSRTNALEALYDDLLTALQSLLDDDIRPLLAADLDPFHHGFAVLDHKHVDPFLIGDQRRLRDQYFFH